MIDNLKEAVITLTRNEANNGETYLRSDSVIVSPRPPTYRVVMVLSSGGSSRGIVEARLRSLSATGSFIP